MDKWTGYTILDTAKNQGREEKKTKGVQPVGHTKIPVPEMLNFAHVTEDFVRLLKKV